MACQARIQRPNIGRKTREIADGSLRLVVRVDMRYESQVGLRVFSRLGPFRSSFDAARV
jgi:hypothetical protein